METEHCSKAVCADVLKRALAVDIPWAKLLPFLAEIQPDDTIHFNSFLERYRVKIARYE